MVEHVTFKHIKDLAPGESGKIVGYEKGDPAYKAKLLSMGLTKGIEVRVIKRAPLGDPIELEVRGYRLSLRKDEAHTLILEGSNEGGVV
ncbi:MAG: FeoA family protein [Spirochaetota bacterium]